jgi:hypothetical protein
MRRALKSARVGPRRYDTSPIRSKLRQGLARNRAAVDSTLSNSGSEIADAAPDHPLALAAADKGGAVHQYIAPGSAMS